VHQTQSRQILRHDVFDCFYLKPALIIYEYPLSERVRTLLRLEDLFDRVGHFMERPEHALEHHAALTAIFDIVDVAGRADLKSDLMQELERQRQVLGSFRGAEEVEQSRLESVLEDIDTTHAKLSGNAMRTGQHVRENEWLMSVKSRTSIPGGACEFDLPSFHYWLSRPAADRARDLTAWLAPLLPLRDGLTIVLRLLRDSGKPVEVTAMSGQFQQMLSGRVAQLIRVRMADAAPYIPEISANKYALMVRFTEPGEAGWGIAARPRQAGANVPFELTYCNL
jgi:cell division protein ZapD